MNSPDRRNSVLNVQNSSGTTFCTNSLVTLKLKLVREKWTRSLLQSSDKRFSGYLVTDVKSLKICIYYTVDYNFDSRIC